MGGIITTPASAAAPFPACPAYGVIDTHGINEDDGSISVAGHAFVDAFNQAMPEGVTLGEQPNPYHSFQLIDALTDSIKWGASPSAEYLSAISIGITTLHQMIKDQQTTCGSQTKMVLTGHSAGAQVTGDLFQDKRLSNPERAAILGVSLFADPRFNHKDSSSQNTSFQVAYQSGLTHDGLMRIFQDVGTRKPFNSPRVVEYCHSDDFVCQDISVKVRNSYVIDLPLLASQRLTGTHSAYGSRGDAADAATYMASLALRLDRSPISHAFALDVPCNDGTSRISIDGSEIPYADPTNDPLVGAVFGQPSDGSGTLSVSPGTYVSLSRLSDGSISFNWAAPAASQTSIPFQVRDAYGATSATYQLTLRRISECAGISLSPAQGPPGSSFSVSGRYFRPNETVLLSLDSASLGTTVTDSSGAFEATGLIIPGGASIGTHAVHAVGQASGLSVGAEFTVTAGTPLQWLTGGYGGGGGVWSPGGDRFLFGAGDDELLVRDLASWSFTPVPVRSATLPGGPAWSPDGSQVAFFGYTNYFLLTSAPISSDDPKCLLAVANLLTGDIRTFTWSDGYAVMSCTFSWSPNGSQIAFVSSHLHGDTPGLYVLDILTGTTTLLTKAGMGGEVGTPSLSGTPSWSPNGKRLAFYSNEPFVPRQPESAVKIYNLATGSVTLASVAQDGTLVGGSANIPLTAVWSPNGNKLIFRGDSPYHIYEKDLTTGTLTLLDAARDGLAPIPTIYGFAVTWVGGAARVAFEDSTQSVYVLDEAGDTLMAVDGYARQPSWSADGERLAVYGYENSHAEWKVWDFTTKDMEDVRDPSFPENDAGFAQWSPTGSRLAFSTFAPLLGAGNYNGGLEVYARDFR